MEPGLYVTFFDRDDLPGRELPPVGPLDNVVLRQKTLLAERRSVTQAQELGVAIDRWLEAELELQRATGIEPGGSKRTERRFISRDGVYLRFVVFGDDHERESVPELGPFATVVVGSRGVDADGTQLATRAPSELAPWELTSGSGETYAGTHKPDIALRTANTAYHPALAATSRPAATPRATTPQIALPIARTADPMPIARTADPMPITAPPVTRVIDIPAPPGEPVFAPPPEAWPGFIERPKRETQVYSARADAPLPPEPALTPTDRELIARLERERQEETLRARIQVGERKRLGVDDAVAGEATTFAMRYRPQAQTAAVGDTAAGLEWGPALWRTRFVIIGLLLLFVAGYYFFAIRNGGAPTIAGQQQLTYANIAQRISSPRWDYTANGVQKIGTAGRSAARGQFYVVRMAVTNRGTEGAQLSPSEFTLIDPNGLEYRAESLASGAYQGTDNPSSPFIWPQSFPVGRTISVSIVFDVDPALPRGMLLVPADLPSTRIRLD